MVDGSRWIKYDEVEGCFCSSSFKWTRYRQRWILISFRFPIIIREPRNSCENGLAQILTVSSATLRGTGIPSFVVEQYLLTYLPFSMSRDLLSATVLTKGTLKSLVYRVNASWKTCLSFPCKGDHVASFPSCQLRFRFVYFARSLRRELIVNSLAMIDPFWYLFSRTAKLGSWKSENSEWYLEQGKFLFISSVGNRATNLW